MRALEVRLAEADNSRDVEDSVYDIQNSLDGVERTSKVDCFVSNKTSNGWAKLQIPWSYVPHIELLTIESNTGHRLCEAGLIGVKESKNFSIILCSKFDVSTF